MAIKENFKEEKLHLLDECNFSISFDAFHLIIKVNDRLLFGAKKIITVRSSLEVGTGYVLQYFVWIWSYFYYLY